MAVLGKLICWNPQCGEEYPVTENDKGTLSMKCLHCGFSPYWPVGQKVHQDVRAMLTKPADPAPVPAPKAEPQPAPAPRKRSMLNPFAA